MHSIVWLYLMVQGTGYAQPLTLADAVRQALEKHPEIQAAAERTRAADARLEQARTGILPRISYTESVQAGNHPVYVFGSLLTQRQFTESNFALDALNRPDPLANFQSVITVDQVLWDAGRTRTRRLSASLGRALSEEDQQRARLNTIARVVDAYFLSKLAQQNVEAAKQSVSSAEADLERAKAVRGAGLSTDADVLSIRVHLAAMREQQIRRAADLEVARAALNEAMGLPLETQHELSTELRPAPTSATEPAGTVRPELKQARLAVDLARSQQTLARSALLPEVGARFAFEADRQQFVRKGGANWLFSASLRWNLFNGEDRPRIRESVHSLKAAEAQAKRVEAGIRLEVRRAQAALTAAQERIKVAEAAVEMAEESLRIIKNRYEAGITTVTELLRGETALSDARTRHYAALYEQRAAAAAVELAAGTLSSDSEVLK